MKYLFFLILPFQFFAQNYDDVLVIINSNSSQSIEIGSYFSSLRNLPQINQFEYPFETGKDISVSDFNAFKNTIRNYLQENEISEQINYVVSTIDCPFNIDTSIHGVANIKPSFEHSIMLLNQDNLFDSFLAYSEDNSESNFSSQAFNHYLSSRLDGPNVQSIKRMIDNRDEELIIGDINPIGLDYVANEVTSSNVKQALLNKLLALSELLNENNISNRIDSADIAISSGRYSTYLYYGMPTEDIDNQADIDNGGLSIVYTCNSTDTESDQFNISVFDILEKGGKMAVGANTCVYVNSYDFDNFFKRLFLQNEKFNVAEAFHFADKNTATVLFGDPKTRISYSLSSLDELVEDDDILVYPTLAQDVLNVNGIKGKYSYKIFDVNGKVLINKNSEAPHISISHLSSNNYFILIQNHKHYKVLKFQKID